MITRDFKLYLTAGHELPVVINVNQYDRDERWVFTLYESKDRIYIPASGSVIGIKADGKLIANAGELNANGQVIITETEQMTAVPGKSTFELLIDEGLHGTANFYVLVERSPADKGIVSESDLSLIHEAIDSVSPQTIREKVQDWMDENLSGDSAVVDRTLMLDGAAADSLTVGSALREKVSDGYVEEGVAYFTNGEDVLFSITGIGGGSGGGGGGGSGNNAVLTVTNTTGWLSKAIAETAECVLSLSWSSMEDGFPTGVGNLTVKVNNVLKINRTVQQGNVSVDVTDYLSTGANSIKVQITDSYSNMKTLNFTVNVVVLKIESSFNDTAIYTEAFNFPYIPTGIYEKTVYFKVDGSVIGTATVSASGRQGFFTIPVQTHGAHTLECYFTATINEEIIESNHLYYSFIFVVSGNNTIIISSAFDNASVPQYSTLQIPYIVYDPRSLTTDITLWINNIPVSQLSDVDRTKHTWTYRCDTQGTHSLSIHAGEDEEAVSKSFTVNVTASDIDVTAETSALDLYLTAYGRSNSEVNRNVWSYESINATMDNFNFTSNGWRNDNDGNTVLRVANGASVTIPFKPFTTAFQDGDGKTFEFEFATRDVSDYESVLVSCWSGDDHNQNYRGFKLTPQMCTIRSANTELSTLYKDNEHLRVSFVIEPAPRQGQEVSRGNSRLICCYINGIMSGAVQYGLNDDFRQLNPVNITIGSEDATIDIYSIRIYNSALSSYQIVQNWIADTQDISEMLDRYNRNDIFDASAGGVITTQTLPSYLPYFILECPELPQYKGDKKTITGSYVNPQDSSKSFTFTGCQINVQGTSSAVYYRKNYDMQFKKGFLMDGESETVANYSLREGSIPFNRFVLKADVASSDGANNTELVMFYNDTCPYKTPEMMADSKVRWGIEGIPIAVFWYDTNTGTTNFMGKYNFNLPKRAPAPYGYDPDNNNDESWEFEQNNSENVKFQDNDFTTQIYDAVNEKYYPKWYDDFEARFPSDEWRDISQINEFLTWVLSTWRDKATNAALAENVTYILPTSATVDRYVNTDSSFTKVEETSNGVATGNFILTFTKDTPAYRLTKFRAEFSEYAEVDSAAFYYLFTELFLMIDSRAKNMFVGFHGSAVNDSSRHMKRKAVFEPYDMDTAIGINNSGVLKFGYSLEDTDTVTNIVSGGSNSAPVFNAQDSVLWCNFRDSFRAEINAMYRSLRSGDKPWEYSKIETRFENHQSKWAESVYNEDAYIKYLIPLINPVTVDETTGNLIRTARYLTMLQGSKAEQRKWWLWNRFRYFDSKFNTGDATTNNISFRAFAPPGGATLTLTSATDLYVSVAFGGGSTPLITRTTAGSPVSFTHPSSSNEMETWIYSADMLVDIGGLPDFYPNELELSKATRLERLQIGSSAAGYSNANLDTIDVSNCVMLKYIDCRNCPNLSQEINLSNSHNLEEVYFDNTSIGSIALPEGGVLEVLHVPSTLTALRIVDQPNLVDLTMPSFSNLTTLVLENAGTVVDSYQIVRAMGAQSRIRIIGFDWTVNNIDEVLRVLSRGRGIDANGRETNLPQLAGIIRVNGSITTADLAFFTNLYPDVTVTYTSLRTAIFHKYAGSKMIEAADGAIITDASVWGCYQQFASGSIIWLPNISSINMDMTLSAWPLILGVGKQGDTEVIPLTVSWVGNRTTSKIYVPDTLVESYKIATNWSPYADVIYPLSEAPYESWNGGVLSE